MCLDAENPYYVFIDATSKAEFISKIERYFETGMQSDPTNFCYAFSGNSNRMSTGPLIDTINSLPNKRRVVAESYGMKAKVQHMSWLMDLMEQVHNQKVQDLEIVLDIAVEEIPTGATASCIPLVYTNPSWLTLWNALEHFSNPNKIKVSPLFQNYQVNIPRSTRFGGIDADVPADQRENSNLWTFKVYPKIAHIWKNEFSFMTDKIPWNVGTFVNGWNYMSRMLDTYKDQPGTISKLRYE